MTAVTTPPRAEPDDLPVLELPTDRPRPAIAGTGVHTAAVTAGVAAAHRRLARDEGTTPAVVALAVYTVFLAHLSRQRDIAVGAPRPVVTSLAGRPSLRDAVARVRDAVAGDGPAGPAAFTWGTPGPDASRADLALALREDGDAITGELACSDDLFDPPAAARLAGMLGHLLTRTAAAPDEPVFAMSPLPPAERDRILHGLHPYARPDITATTMAEPFEEQVRRTPDAEAVVTDDASLTYAELNARANRLARLLRAAGARPGAFVAVSMERSLDLMVALYAVAKSGAAYVPIDPELPDARMAFMLDDSAPVAVLTDAATRPRLPAYPGPVLAVDEDAEQWAGRPEGDLPPLPGNHLIHMLYTSGTTGRPKAVAYPVDGALADIGWLHGRYPYRPGDTAILKTSYGFDVSIWEIFWPLYRGARVAVCPPGAHRDPVRLRDFVDRHRVTAMFMVPTMMPPFHDHTPPGSCPSLRHVFCGGEPVTPRIRDAFHERFAAALVNCCGPTELGCVAETVLPVEPGAPVVIGTPPAHRRVYILDDNLEPAPIGVPGELFVGGEVGIAQGYHRRPALSAERFLADPFAGDPGARMYRTGDLCRYRADGTIEHLGRIGRQVKVRGVRIELAEIEAVLAEHADVGQCVVTVVPDRAEIAAFVTPAPGRTVAAAAVGAHAATLLPTAMRPSTVTVVDHIPTFVHGKVDVAALLSRIDRSGGAGPLLVPPANDLEARVARIYCDILGRDAVSVTESFFVLGGHSLLVFKLIERCTDEFQVDLSVKDVLGGLSARGLAAAIARLSAAETAP